MKILWNGYIQEQLHWAERLAAIAADNGDEQASRLKAYAERALANARGAANAQLSSAPFGRSLPQA